MSLGQVIWKCTLLVMHIGPFQGRRHLKRRPLRLRPHHKVPQNTSQLKLGKPINGKQAAAAMKPVCCSQR